MAAALFVRLEGAESGASIVAEKRIPIIPAGAGMSTDLLARLNSLATAAELREIGRASAMETLRRADFGLWLSLVERLSRVQEVQGSNPCSPI